MGHSLVLWTASLLAQAGTGQIIEYPAQTQGRSCGCQQAQISAQPGTDRFMTPGGSEKSVQATDIFQPQPDRPGFFVRLRDRLSNLFARLSNPLSGPAELGQPSSSEPSLDMTQAPPMIHNITASEPPQANVPASPKIVQVGFASSNPPPPVAATAVPVVQGQANTGAILPKFVNKIGHEEDYSWVTGQLGQANGQWVIHYATPGTVDTYGGKLVLVGNVNMTGYQVGDLISVQGALMSQNGRLGGAYQVHHVTLIEH